VAIVVQVRLWHDPPMKKFAVIVTSSLLLAASLGIWFQANGLLMPENVHTLDDMARARMWLNLAPWISAGLFVIGVVITRLAWRRERATWFRAVSVLPLLGLLAAVFITRGTVVEAMMFSPVEEARFVPVAEASFLETDDLVLGVSIGGEAKAYPVRMLAYHHIVNDRLAGEPYVATY
jgi:hypothetical protein